jgi:hypothetical protein
VAATDAANNALLSINVTGGVDTVSAPPTTVAELDVSVDFMADVRKAEITVNDKAPDVATTVRFRATFESGESIIVGAAIAAGLTKANAAKAIAQALNAEDMLTADSSRAVAEVIGQGSNVLTDFVKL